MKNNNIRGWRFYIRFCLVIIMLAGTTAGVFGIHASAENTRQQSESYTIISLQHDQALSTTDDVVLFNDELALFGNGPYYLQGELENLSVHARAKGETILILDGVSITNPNGEAMCSDAKCSMKLILVDESQNVLTSGTQRELIPDKEAKGAALYAKGDLMILGSGSLTVNGFSNNGVRCKGELVVSDTVDLTIQASNRAIRASDFSMEGGNLMLRSGDNSIYTERSLSILGGELTVETSDNCFLSDGTVSVEGGNVSLKSTDKRGIMAMGPVTVSGGSVFADVLGDGIYSNQGIEVYGGNVLICSGGDGLQVEEEIYFPEAPICLTGGEVLISAYEDAIDSPDGYRINGSTLLATEITGQRSNPADSSRQRVFFQSIKGKKHDEVSLVTEAEELLCMEAAYGYNMIIFSVPEDTVTEEIKVRVGS